jgi:alcohol dehydrogenase
MTDEGADAPGGTGGERVAASDFRFDYRPPTIRFGRGSVADLGDELAELDADRALVVTGQTVGTTPAVMDPIRAGLGDRLAGVFAETTPEKRLATALAARDRLREADADALVAVGGGSSLDVATVAALLAGDDRAAREVGAEFAERGTLAVPDADLPPVVAVPTTLAGAELSQVAGITADPAEGVVDSATGGGVSDPRLMPAATVYDPELVATTPAGVLAASAMNGFDKGVETCYARNRTPVTDATASRGLGLLAPALREMGSALERDPESTGALNPETLTPVLEGIVLVQYGVSQPEGVTLSLIHAFGHAVTRTSPVQQGAAHGILAPHALRYLFAQCDGRRELLAEAFGVADAEDPAEAVVREVASVRDALGLPTRLRDVDGPDPEEFPDVAQAVLDDSFMANAPAGLDATSEGIEGVLRDAY